MKSDHHLKTAPRPAGSVASWTNPSLSPATGLASQDRSARCHDYCSRLAEWRSACGLYSQRADCYVPRSGAFAYPVSREEAARYQNQIQVLVVVLIPFVQSDLC